MPKTGTRVLWGADRKPGIVVGLKRPHHGQWNEERNNVPSVHRVRIQCESVSRNVAFHVHPLLKRVEVAA